MNSDDEYQAELADLGCVSANNGVFTVPQTILKYNELVNSMNGASIFDSDDYNIATAKDQSSANSVNDQDDAEFGNEPVVRVISGRGRGGRNFYQRPGSSSNQEYLDVTRYLRKIAPLGYGNEITENSIRAHRAKATRKNTSNATQSSSDMTSVELPVQRNGNILTSVEDHATNQEGSCKHRSLNTPHNDNKSVREEIFSAKLSPRKENIVVSPLRLENDIAENSVRVHRATETIDRKINIHPSSSTFDLAPGILSIQNNGNVLTSVQDQTTNQDKSSKNSSFNSSNNHLTPLNDKENGKEKNAFFLSHRYENIVNTNPPQKKNTTQNGNVPLSQLLRASRDNCKQLRLQRQKKEGENGGKT